MKNSVTGRTRHLLAGHRLSCLVFLIVVASTIFILLFNTINSKGRYKIVVIDAGHGGVDPGKIGVNGQKEKDINLEIAIKLREQLEQRGIKVIMTRECDEDKSSEGATNKKRSDMENRVEIVNSSGADCLISIHQNSFETSNIKGAQTFYYGSSAESRLLAEKIQSNMIEQVDNTNTRKAAKGNDYYILRKSKCPAVIVECGFLSNPEEAEKMADEDYQNKIAKAIADAVCEK